MKTSLALLGLAALPAAHAQQLRDIPPSADPGVIQERAREIERRLREEQERKPPEGPTVDDEAIKRVPAKPAAPAARFMLRRIDFTASEVLTESTLRELAATLEGREVSLADVQALVDRINALYREKGVPTAQAVLPPQEVADGAITIKLVEGRIGKVTVDGNATTSTDFILARVGQQPGQLADVGALERGLQRFNRTQDVQLRAELKPGARFAETDVAVSASEPKRHEMRLFTDTSGSQATGVYRVGLFYQNRSLLGFRDSLGVTLTGADGHEGRAISYSFPLGTLGTRLSLSWFNDHTRIVNGPFTALRIRGESTAYTAQLRHPLLIGSDHQLDLLVGAKTRKTESWTFGTKFQSTDIDDMSLGVDGQWWERDRIWNASLNWSHGKAKPIDDIVTTSFSVWRGAVRRVQELAPGWSVHNSFTFQYTGDDNLTSSEQFLIGGEGSVRGYQTALFSGDKGLTASVELHHPLPQPPEIPMRTSGFLFLDYGATKPFRPNESTRGTDTLASYGWGVNANINERVQARLTFGLPIRDRIQDPRDYYVHFQLVAQLF
ncbi:ShlB/FhaC/HecB family hemolysin secretion/activation protein [Methyloversatilis thermotolerans]|uniref:ShlB/FhaC/HecB family hemolysin secretion/activation protein n=1 Tax=Methyloversatilis thermotolerans TaxID=1346290 RepID=UPI001E51350F|nr:ShlB/FhaC/HecB family hemolysin secretion/activation protein [Methyloversatilis thermotolerans]